MFEVIGWLVLIVPLGWLSIFVFFTTIDTFGAGLFSGKWYHKILATMLWIALLSAWLWWFSFIQVTI